MLTHRLNLHCARARHASLSLQLSGGLHATPRIQFKLDTFCHFLINPSSVAPHVRTHSGGTELAPRYASDLSALSFSFSSEWIFTVLRGETGLSGER